MMLSSFNETTSSSDDMTPKKSRLKGSRPKVEPQLGKSKHRKQKYRKDWEVNPIFKDWLRPHADPLKANCQFCRKTMVAEVTVLKNHIKTKLHCRLAKQTVSPFTTPAFQSKDVDNSVNVTKVGESVSVTKTVVGIKERAKYRKEWEANPEFSHWLEPDPNPHLARCRICIKSMVASIPMLNRHKCSKTHQRIVSATSPPRTAYVVNTEQTIDELAVKAEIKLAGFFSDHQINSSVADDMISLLKEICQDSEIMNKVSAKRINSFRKSIKESIKEEIARKVQELILRTRIVKQHQGDVNTGERYAELCEEVFEVEPCEEILLEEGQQTMILM